MPEITIRRIYDEELHDAYFAIDHYSFFQTPPMPNRETVQRWYEHRHGRHFYTLFEDETPLATASIIPMTQNVRGQVMPMGGVAGVATLPQARRKGYVRRLMHHLYAVMREANIALSTLYPFRESFYERLGYATFPQVKTITFEANTLAPVLKWAVPGDVTYHLRADAHEAYRAYLRELQRLQHGFSMKNDADSQLAIMQNDYWVALARVDDTPVGTMLYKISGHQGQMSIRRFYAHRPEGRYLLLQWLARHIDHVKTMHLEVPATEHPETWLADMNIKQGTTDFLTPMGRVVDVRGLTGLPVGEGAFTVRLEDQHAPWNAGIFTFEGTPEGLHVRDADEASETLSIQGLSALIYGTHDPASFTYRGWGTFTAATMGQMRQIFTPMRPHLHEEF